MKLIFLSAGVIWIGSIIFVAWLTAIQPKDDNPPR